MSNRVFVGRQPILDSKGNVFAYELLYRNGEANAFPDINPEQATIQLLVNTFLTIGIENVSGSHLSFINFTEELLSNDFFMDLNPKQVVIEVLENVAITPVLVTRLRKFKTEGFQIALDDFVLDPQVEVYNELFRIIDYIKVDYLNTTVHERNDILAYVKKFPHICLLGEKIETVDQYQNAKNNGYKLFQGFYFARPEIIQGIEIPSTMQLHVYILEQLNVETPNVDEITELIMQDISIAYKLLRYINTLAFEVPKKIDSIKQAIVLIGLENMKKWLRVLILTDLSQQTKNDQVKALISYSLTRAKYCELLAKHTGRKNVDEYFLTGMFSLINLILNKSWDETMKLFPLSDNIKETIMGENTNLSYYLELAISTERFEWDRVGELAQKLNVSIEKLSEFTVKANKWTQSLD